MSRKFWCGKLKGYGRPILCSLWVLQLHRQGQEKRRGFLSPVPFLETSTRPTAGMGQQSKQEELVPQWNCETLFGSCPAMPTVRDVNWLMSFNKRKHISIMNEVWHYSLFLFFLRYNWRDFTKLAKSGLALSTDVAEIHVDLGEVTDQSFIHILAPLYTFWIGEYIWGAHCRWYVYEIKSLVQDLAYHQMIIIKIQWSSQYYFHLNLVIRMRRVYYQSHHSMFKIKSFN